MNDIKKVVSFVEKPKNRSNKKISKNKLSSVFFQNNEESRNYTLLMFEKLLNKKKKNLFLIIILIGNIAKNFYMKKTNIFLKWFWMMNLLKFKKQLKIMRQEKH